jgi:single-strand DNA-binding protein
MEALVQMTGYVGGEVSYRSSGVAVADFRLGCTPRLQRGSEWVDGETTWITVKAFRSLADHVAASLRRGDPVVVVGKLRTSVWSRDGATYERLELDALTVGHDLRRGTAVFRRAVRHGSASDDEVADVAADAPSPSPDASTREAQDGGLVQGAAA